MSTNMIRVIDMEVGKKYLVNGVSKTLTQKMESGTGGSGNQEPYFELIFDNSVRIVKDWDDKYENSVNGGGKQKSRRNRKSKKSRNNRRKSNRRR